MMFLTAKVDLKKILLVLAGITAVVLALILLLGDGSAQTSAPAVSANDTRVQFLKSFGWELTPSPKESNQVRIPTETSEVFTRYNNLQKSQGYDLDQYAGKRVMRYVYEITNFPNATGPVYATLLVHKDKIIGGDITDMSAGGHIGGFRMGREDCEG